MNDQVPQANIFACLSHFHLVRTHTWLQKVHHTFLPHQNVNSQNSYITFMAANVTVADFTLQKQQVTSSVMKIHVIDIHQLISISL